MSYQAMEAVQDSSQYSEPLPENDAPFRIMLAIARYADRFGVAGVAGQYRKCPSQRAIAKTSKLHHNTVNAWLPRLVEAGEIVLESGGSGRGSWTVYHIALPIESDERSGEMSQVMSQPAELMSQGISQQLEEISQGISHLTQLISQGMSQGNGLMSQGNVTNVTSPSTENGQIHDPLIQTDPQKQPDPKGDPADFFDFDWDTVLETLKNSMTKDTYAANFQGTTAAICDGTLVIATKNQYQADWINGRLKRSVSRTVNDLTGHKLGVFARPEPLANAEGVTP